MDRKQAPTIKVVLSDVDGVLTDGGLYFTEKGDQFKRFHVHDGMGFLLLKERGFTTGIITSENLELVRLRAQRIRPDYLYMNLGFEGKLEAAREIAAKEGCSLDEMAYIGDDVNCIPLLQAVGQAFCPSNAVEAVKAVSGIHVLTAAGGHGAFREMAELLLRS
ncbi:MAG TPA: 3-deoxy-D-manno-octulosonate 8-phosphate phosphatase [Bacteroidetes bacterium]|jgi:3-deoxy-D-manno-octulosonate 8-phosphate phosphatase (KDO 8-P phosphatase)|nr:MAG: 3-deoxy-D-manno-octulosonate 8-phosphate phosphatase [Sphingobacteriales bacterium BACL12 MAG-120802-bin5]KRP09988.1 MAG: 3-deoxy-D-manno-octulosonate 8-phosphate phosphatase [Sphingobacteriales bacterium BACL12 MAG-120813-bin55]HCK21297.1 3-deoxy-D-manno-octulosonate 8-phosphate phosphatase [Bacteroidota bacterium]